MFKFLSIFKRNNDEQENDNDYDFRESPAPVDIQGGLDKTPALVDNAIGGAKQEPSAKQILSIDTTADQARINEITNELSGLSAGLQPPQEEENKSSMLTTPEVEKEGHLQPPNLDLVKGYKETREEKPPGVTHYKNGDIELWFVNTKHEHTGGIHDDPTLRTVKMVIDGNDPAFLITEGHMTNMTDAERKRLLEANRELAEAGGNMPESGYAAYLANQKNLAGQKEISWVGGEPSGTEFFERMQEDYGYSKEDILAITLLKKIADGNFKGVDFGTQYTDIMQRTAARLDPQDELDLSKTVKDFTFEKFQEWYASQALPEGENFLDIHPRHFVPDPKRENIIHRWMADSGEERDRHIARVIYDQLEEHHKGVITYGADHLNSLAPVLDQMFGSPGEYTQLVKN